MRGKSLFSPVLQYRLCILFDALRPRLWRRNLSFCIHILRVATLYALASTISQYPPGELIRFLRTQSQPNPGVTLARLAIAPNPKSGRPDTGHYVMTASFRLKRLP